MSDTSIGKDYFETLPIGTKFRRIEIEDKLGLRHKSLAWMITDLKNQGRIIVSHYIKHEVKGCRVPVFEKVEQKINTDLYPIDRFIYSPLIRL